jgi:hypothetical protein
LKAWFKTPIFASKYGTKSPLKYANLGMTKIYLHSD